jgi:hypothetical protein
LVLSVGCSIRPPAKWRASRYAFWKYDAAEDWDGWEDWEGAGEVAVVDVETEEMLLDGRELAADEETVLVDANVPTLPG